ncbi:TetR/AcrR family transcriptional regulator [Microbacterium sp. NPDC089696]|uniref:TetR/AcrR family transcriptional regulator n=1 Tax=Microbacterium sp. NPDC089696 TaxID=3364199 RepID=UPI0038225B30
MSPAPGRPRKSPRLRRGEDTAEQILDASAELFSQQGYSGTSIAQIATAVGVGQQSIYHHFGSKAAILKTLLMEGIRPSLEIADAIERVTSPAKEDSPGRLFSLALADATLLASWRWNVGAILLSPEARSEEMSDYQQARLRLRERYVTWSRDVVDITGSEDVGDQVLRLVVSIINQRSDGQATPETPALIARSGLRICGWAGSFTSVESDARSILERAKTPLIAFL